MLTSKVRFPLIYLKTYLTRLKKKFKCEVSPHAMTFISDLCSEKQSTDDAKI